MKRLREIFVVLLIGIGGLSLGLLTITHWAERQILTADNWVELVSPIPREPAVSSALGSYIANQLFENVPIEQKITDALPPNAAFLAGPLSDQLQNTTTKLTQKIVASDGFQTVWTGANRVAINRLLTQARSTSSTRDKINQKFNIDLASVKTTLNEKLGRTATILPALDSSDKSPLILSTDLKSKRQTVRQFIRTIDFLNKVLPFVALTSFIWACALSRKRRRTIGISLSIIIVIALLELILVKVLHQQVTGSVQNTQYIPAVSYVYETLVGLFVTTLRNELIVAILLALLWFFAGPSRWALAVRKYLRIDKLRHSRPAAWWQALRKLALQYRYYIWAAISLLALFYLAVFAELSWAVTINTIATALILGGMLYLLAYPINKPSMKSRK